MSKTKFEHNVMTQVYFPLILLIPEIDSDDDLDIFFIALENEHEQWEKTIAV